MILNLPGGALLRLSKDPSRWGRWRADLVQESISIGPDGVRQSATSTTVATGILPGDSSRAAIVLRRLAGDERAPLERTLAALGSLIAASAGLVGTEAWTMDIDGDQCRIVDRHGSTRVAIGLPIPGWGDLPGRFRDAGRALVPRAALPTIRTAHGRALLSRILAEDLAFLGLPDDLPERLTFGAALRD